MGDPRSWGDRPELVDALRAEHGVTELPDPEIDLPAWLVDERPGEAGPPMTADADRRTDANPGHPRRHRRAGARRRRPGSRCSCCTACRRSPSAACGCSPAAGSTTTTAEPGDDEPTAARRAAAREALEECGLAVEPTTSCRSRTGCHRRSRRGGSPPGSSWPAPATARSSSTAARSTSTSGSPAREVLDRRDRGRGRPGPADLGDAARPRPSTTTSTRRCGGRPRATRSPTTRPAGPTVAGGAVAMWDGDAGYDAADPDQPGAAPPPLDARGRLAPRAA